MNKPIAIEELLAAVEQQGKPAPVEGVTPEDSLAAISRELSTAQTWFDRHRIICEQIVRIDRQDSRQPLLQLRSAFEAKTSRNAIQEIESALSTSIESGWQTWLATVSESIYRFKYFLAVAVCKHRFSFDWLHEQLAKELRRAVECLRQSRWDEAYDEITFLSQQQFLSPLSRARLIALRAQLDLLRFDNPHGARKLFEEALQLAPDDGWIVASMGDYWLAEKDFAKTAELYKRAIMLAPQEANGYVGMGDLAEKQGHSDESATWYRKAVENAAGDSLGYERLLSAQSGSDKSEATKDKFSELLENRIAIETESAYDTYISAGGVFLSAGQYPTAREWYEKSIQLQPNWPRAYVELAELCETQGNLTEAEALCKKTIELSRDYPKSYLVLVRIYEAGSRWADALKVYEAFPERPRQWASFVRSSIGRTYSRLGEYDVAERLLFESLREDLKIDPSERRTQNILEDVADDLKRSDNREAAKRIYDTIFAIVGVDYEDRYHNFVGNLHYYYSQFEEAVAEYKKASAAAPAKPEYWRYVSSAYESMKRYDEAEDALESAFKIDGDKQLLDSRKATLANLRGNDAFAIAAYEPAAQLYETACELEPAEPVYFGNLAGALERVKDSGSRRQHLEQAAAQYQRAAELSKGKKYMPDVERLRSRLAVLGSYGEKVLEYYPVVTPIAIEVAANLIPYVEATDTSALSPELSVSINSMRERFSAELGISITGIRIRGNEADLPDGTYIIFIEEVPIVMGTVSTDKCLYVGASEFLTDAGIKGELNTNESIAHGGYWIGRSDLEKLDRNKAEAKGFEIWDITECMVRHLEKVLRHNAIDLLGHQEAVQIIAGVSAATKEPILRSSSGITALTSVIKGLAAEGVPLTPHDDVCTTFNELSRQGVSQREIVERIRLQPAFRTTLPGDEERIAFKKLSRPFEEILQRSIYTKGEHVLFAIEPEICQAALAAVRENLDDRPTVLVVENALLRPFVRKLVELEFPFLQVISKAEMHDGVDMAQLPTIDWDGDQVTTTPQFSHPSREGSAVSDVGTQPEGAKSEVKISVEVLVSSDFEKSVTATEDEPLDAMFAKMVDGLFYELGILIPTVKVQSDRNLKFGECVVRINGVESRMDLAVKRDEFLVNDTVDRLALLNIKGSKAVNPANGVECAIVRNDDRQKSKCVDAGLTVWGPGGYLVLSLASEVRRSAAQFQSDSISEYMLETLGEYYPDLVRIARERYGTGVIAQVLRELLNEQMSIRNLRAILESLLSIDATTDVDLSRYIVFFANTDGLCPAPTSLKAEQLCPAQLTDFVRGSLKRYISHKYTRGSNTLAVYLVQADMEARLTESISKPLSKKEHDKLLDAVREEIGSTPAGSAAPVVLTSFDCRRVFKKLIETEFPRLAVVSYQELSPDTNIQPIARISW